MKIPRALVVLLVAEVFFVHATLNSLLKPFQILLGWRGSSKLDNASIRIGNNDAAHDHPKAEQEVDHWTTVGSSRVFSTGASGKSAKGFALLPEDFNTTASTEPTKVSSPADSPDQTALSSKLATTTTPSSGHSTSVASSTDPTTSVRSVSAQTAAAKSFHMVDLKIPGGENPDTETLPDVASFKPDRPLESADTETVEKPSEFNDAESEGLKDESPSPDRATSLSSILVATSTSTAAPPTTTTDEIAVTAASHEMAPAPRPTTEESAREPDRFRSFQQPAQSFVFEDVNDLFQSDD